MGIAMSREAEMVYELFRKRGITLAFAESCTAGQLCAEMGKISGVSAVLQGSVVSYSNQAKQELLDFKASTLTQHGAVSEQVAIEMARGARHRLHADFAVSVTGIAGPAGGTTEKPIGTVCFGLCGPKLESTFKTRFYGDREEIQAASVKFALECLITAINTSQKES